MSREHPTRTRMVHLRTVTGAFEAQVIAARLGADGVLTELRGNVGGPYPFGEASVWVPEDEVDVARALLLADEVEAAFEPDEAPPSAHPAWPRRLVAAAGLLGVASAAFAAHLGL